MTTYGVKYLIDRNDRIEDVLDPSFVGSIDLNDTLINYIGAGRIEWDVIKLYVNGTLYLNTDIMYGYPNTYTPTPTNTPTATTIPSGTPTATIIPTGTPTATTIPTATATPTATPGLVPFTAEYGNTIFKDRANTSYYLWIDDLGDLNISLLPAP
ncbi:MAG: hypothetical protein COT06_05115 [Syntrophobacteraceae bacterium CG07_land_8_20_14_0_80_61_8]|nr:MAG: hypothetical protein COT06_05115 [Syntrophobacteraceae bacterium CG07_land_8_20_14_0_80_61_8]